MKEIEQRMKDAFSRAFWLLVESLRVLDHEELPQVIFISSEDETAEWMEGEMGERMRWVLNL